MRCLKFFILISLLMATTLLAATPLRVAVSIPPLADVVERIGGDQVEVVVLVGPSDSPASYDPTARQVAALARCTVLFTTGVAMENALLPKLRGIAPDLEIVDTTVGLEMINATEHDHGDHHHAEIDPHVWLSPQRLRGQAATIAITLQRLMPEKSARIQTAAAHFDSQLVVLDTEIAAILAPISGRELLAFHPAFGYLAADYGLIQSAVETGGMAPGPKGLAKVLKRAKANNVGAIFVQPQFSMSTARAVASEIGVDLIVLDPLARDTIQNMRAMALTIREALDDQ